MKRKSWETASKLVHLIEVLFDKSYGDIGLIDLMLYAKKHAKEYVE